MTTAARHQHLTVSGGGNGGVVARRAVVRWAWRLFRREWREQILVVALLTVAVATTVFGVATAYNAPSSGRAAAFGTATGVLTLAGDDPQVATDIADVRRRYGAAEVIENQAVTVPGVVNAIDLRVQDPHGRYGQPMLSLVSGRYPTGNDEVAVTSGVAALFDLQVGAVWAQGGHDRRVVGIIENPANLLDQFALLEPGQSISATQVTVLFDVPPAPHPCTSSECARPPQFPGGATAQDWASSSNGASATSIVVVVAIFGLIFIGLVAVAGFTVMAQRRLRSLGMIAALGATDRNVRLVMVSSGAIVGVVGTLLGAAVGLGAWISYVPHLQVNVQRRIEWAHLPWWAIAAAMVLAVVTAIAAAWRPARAAGKVPVVAALSGRPESARASYLSAGAGLLLLGSGLGCLASAGGWSGVQTRHNVTVPSALDSTGGLAAGLTGWTTGEHTSLLFAGIAATVVGVLLLAPLAVAAPGLVARQAPVAVRLALRDLGRYRARSGTVLAAISFTVLLAVVIAILTTASSSDPFTPSGPNLADNQIIVYAPHGRIASGPKGFGPPPTPAQQQALQTSVTTLAADIHATFALPLYSAGRLGPGANTPEAETNQRAELWQVSGQKQQFNDPLYVATPALLRDFGINPSQIHPDTDLLTTTAGLTTATHLQLIGEGDVFSRHTPTGNGIPGSLQTQCPPVSCIANPKIQAISGLPSGTSAPSTVITEHAVQALGQQLILDGWLLQTAGPFTAAQKNTARQSALSSKTRMEVGSGAPDLSTTRLWASAAGILLALAVLAMTVGLIRSETASDLRILTAAGASRSTRRAITAATAGALALTGAIVGTAAAYLAVITWAHGDLRDTLVPVPVAELLTILVGLPMLATIGGWLLAGREPRGISRLPLE
jgi:putative ABC transport system permease protein